MNGPDPAILRAAQQARAGQTDAAVSALRRYLQQRPRDATAHQALGEILSRAGQHDQALHHFKQLLSLSRGHPVAHLALVNALIAAGRWPAAHDAARAGLASAPASGELWGTLCLIQTHVGDSAGAVESGRRAVQLSPQEPAAYANLVRALVELGRIDEAIETGERGLAIAPGRADLASSVLIAMSVSDRDPGAVFEAHRRFGATHRPPPNLQPARTPRDPERPLRVGIMSADLRTHSVAYFARPLLAERDRASVHLTCFDATGTRDEMSAALRTLVDEWIDVSACDDATIDARIRAARIDVLIELGGHSAASRLTALVAKPAPVIISAIGYPHTTGVPAVDARVVDSWTDPPGAEAFATERLVRLDPCFLCYTPPADAPEPRARERRDAVTFGTFNVHRKLTAQTLRAWRTLLDHVPRSRLAVKSAGLDDAGVRAALLTRITDAGIDPARVELLPPTPTTRAHLAAYHNLDVALDPWPYCGTTTTCEALWMGVPVVTLAGRTHAARVGVSLLNAIGSPEWIARTTDEYVEIAAGLANDSGRLDALRVELRPRMARSTLCDAKAYGERFYAAVRGLWREWCARA